MRCSIPGDAGGEWLTELYVCGLQVYFDLSPCQDWMLSGATAQLLTLVIVWPSQCLSPGELSMSPGSREAAESGEEVMILRYRP